MSANQNTHYFKSSFIDPLPEVHPDFLRYTVFVLQLPAYLPVYLAPEAYERASAEFSITLFLVSLLWHLIKTDPKKAMALD
jgi:hypothetical protein